MTRSELIDLMASQQGQLTNKDVELAVKLMIDHMAESLASGERIEIRGFGSFSLHYREPRKGRNPKTGDAVGAPVAILVRQTDRQTETDRQTDRQID